MPSPFDDNFRWQRRFIPKIKRVLAEHLVTEAPAEEDRHHNTDLVVLHLEPVRVACRMRRHKYYENLTWREQFTIRSSIEYGETELAKMIGGWGDYFFYGFANQDESDIQQWRLGDLKVFRLWLFRELAKKTHPWIPQRNGDGSSAFAAFRYSDLPDDFVVASGTTTVDEPVPEVDPDDIPF